MPFLINPSFIQNWERFSKSPLVNPQILVKTHKRKIQIPIPEEWIGDHRNNGRASKRRDVALYCSSSTLMEIPPASLDAVLTDPPYLGNVQYAELMDFCYVWLRRLIGKKVDAFQQTSTRNADELTGNVTMDRGLNHFTQGLSEIFSRMAKSLKPGAPLAFTYHHNKLEAYYPISVSILDSGLTCSASLPCPAEMGGSIHINKTGSSIIDTVLICRSTGKVPRRWISENAEEIAGLIRDDIDKLRVGKVSPTRGDIRCIIFGHLARLAVWGLRKTWNRTKPVEEKLQDVADYIQDIGGLQAVEQCLRDDLLQTPQTQNAISREDKVTYRTNGDEISF